MTPRHNGSVRVLVVVLVTQVVLGAAFVALALTNSLPWDDSFRPPASGHRPPVAAASRPKADRFDEDRAWRWLERQVRLGPRPAGSAKSRRLAALAHDALPRGRYQRVPGGLRNVTGFVPGKDPKRYVVIGAHYDTKDMPGFVGANDGAGGTAILLELARALRPGTIGPGVRFVLFDGEESPRGTPDSDFADEGLRGSKVAAQAYAGADAMILLDFVADRRLRVQKEGYSDEGLWEKLQESARAVGTTGTFPNRAGPAILDDHLPFLDRGVPSLDLIDFDFACFHKTCDDLTAVSKASVDATGETVRNLLPRL